MLQIFKRPDFFRKNKFYYGAISVWLIVGILAMAFRFNQTCSMGLNWVILLSLWHPVLDITSQVLQKKYPNAHRENPRIAWCIVKFEFISYILWIASFFFMATFTFYPSDCKQNSPVFYILGTIYTWFNLVLVLLIIINSVYLYCTRPTPAELNRAHLGTEVEGMQSVPVTREVTV